MTDENELKGFFNEAVVTHSRFYSGIFLEGLKNSKKDFSADIRVSGQDSSRGLCEYESKASLVRQSVQ
jgi:hypothetical protein